MITSLLEIAQNTRRETSFWNKVDNLFNKDNKYFCTKISLNFPKVNSTDLYIIFQHEKQQALVIMMESAKPLDQSEYCELVDEEEFMDDRPLWFSQSSHRVSPVFYLNKFMTIVNDLFKEIYPVAEVNGLFMTDVDLLGVDSNEEVYKEMGVYLKDGLSDITNKSIPTKGADNAVFKLCLDNIFDFIQEQNDEISLKHDTTDTDDTEDDLFDTFNNLDLFTWDSYEEETPPMKTKARTADKKESKDNSIVDRGRFASVADLAQFLRQNPTSISINKDMELPDVEIFYPMPEPEKALETMVGLNSIKEKIADVACLAQYNTLKKASGTPFHTLNLHAVFAGNPGTGKSTMARIWASLLHKHGQLSHGHLVLATRSSFVGTKWGMEEENLSKILKIAEGGVLMIDEAYSLVSSHPNDPGRLVLPLLLNRLADESRRNISVVLAGYPVEMDNLLKTNPGITSRFANKFEFCDFSIDQLCEITRNKAAYYGYTFTPSAWKRYKEVLEEAYSRKDRTHFGNARYVANILERIYLQHARRIVNSSVKPKNILRLTIDDIVENERQVNASPCIGFNTRR